MKNYLFNEYWDINDTITYFEIMMPDRRYILWEWNENHKLIEKNTWYI